MNTTLPGPRRPGSPGDFDAPLPCLPAFAPQRPPPTTCGGSRRRELPGVLAASLARRAPGYVSPASPTLGRVSQIERGELSTIKAIARYVQGRGSHLELVVSRIKRPVLTWHR
jgi:hypothetical protein